MLVVLIKERVIECSSLNKPLILNGYREEADLDSILGMRFIEMENQAKVGSMLTSQHQFYEQK